MFSGVKPFVLSIKLDQYYQKVFFTISLNKKLLYSLILKSIMGLVLVENL